MFNCIKISFLLLLFAVASAATAQPTKETMDSLKLELARAKNDSNKVKLYMELGNNASYYDSKEALSYALAGLELSKKVNYPLGKARTTYLLGNTYLDLGDYGKSKSMLDESEVLFEDLGRRDMLGMISNARGNWNYMQGDMWNASHYYTKATEIFHNLGDTIRETMPYQNLIASLGEIKNYEKALSLSIALRERLRYWSDSAPVAHSLNHIILNSVALKKMDQAKKYIPELLSYVDNTLDYNLASDSYNVIGEYYSNAGQTDTAIFYYKKALEKALRNNYQPAQYNLSIGAAYLKKNDLPLAHSYLTTAITQAREANSRDIYFRICLPLSEYYRQSNDFRQAFFYLKEYTKLNDSILVAETRQYSTHLEAVFENSKKETEILKLKTEELNNALQIKKRNNYLYAASAIILISGIFFYFNHRSNKQKRRLLEQDRKLKAERIVFLEKEQQVISLQSMINGQETERNRVAKDLHDGLGGLFSTVKMYFSSLEHDQPQLADNDLFKKSFELADTASVELRRIAHNLMPEVLMKLGLINAVQDLCNNINIGRLLKISLQAYGMEKRLGNNTEIMLYRIIQELLNNIIKHAQATEVIIQFNKHSDRLTVTIEDNGRGFNVDEASEEGKAGISTVRSRVNYLNGQLNIDSRQGVGTTVIMEFLIDDSNRP